MSDSDYIAKGINVSCRTIEDRAYIVLEDRDAIFCLNESGSFIWDAIDGTKTVRQLGTLVMDAYAGVEEDNRQAVSEFISELSDRGMIEISDKPFIGVMQSA